MAAEIVKEVRSKDVTLTDTVLLIANGDYGNLVVHHVDQASMTE